LDVFRRERDCVFGLEGKKKRRSNTDFVADAVTGPLSLTLGEHGSFDDHGGIRGIILYWALRSSKNYEADSSGINTLKLLAADLQKPDIFVKFTRGDACITKT
jgi:hypothetical protein